MPNPLTWAEAGIREPDPSIREDTSSGWILDVRRTMLTPQLHILTFSIPGRVLGGGPSGQTPRPSEGSKVKL